MWHNQVNNTVNPWRDSRNSKLLVDRQNSSKDGLIKVVYPVGSKAHANAQLPQPGKLSTWKPVSTKRHK